MRQVILKVEDSKYAMLMRLLQSLEYVEIVAGLVNQQKSTRKHGYDFSDLAGKLQWQGNALTEQQRLRNEW